MIFSSPIFLFLFLPTVLALYFLNRKTFRNLFLLVASLFFYSWGEQYLVWIVITSTLIDYLAGLIISGGFSGGEIRQLEPGAPRTTLQKFGLVASICSNLAFLGFFKYFNFGLAGFNAIVPASWGFHHVAKIALPIGISFYTFQSMSYTIDVYRGQVRATRRFIDFACYVTLFPQLVAGPIVRYRDIAEQLVERTVDREGFAWGAKRFIIGLGKKVLIANVVAVPADKIFGVTDLFGRMVTPGVPLDELTAPVAWLAVVCYTLQIYFDFSGYSDMAIGLGRMFGFRFLENFNFPYISRSIREFWRRWHISLSTWFRDYLYIPLGGSRSSKRRTYLNLVIVFFLCGLWHGAAWTFVVWGLYHGCFLVLERLGLEQGIRRLWRPLRHVYVLLIVMVGWVLFRSETFSQAVAMLGAMVGFAKGTGVEHNVHMVLDTEVLVVMLAGLVGSIPWLPAFARWREKLTAPGASLGRRALDGVFCVAGVVVLAGILLACSLALSAGTYNPFIYYRF